MSAYEPHKWKYSDTNGFWAHCNCGFSASAFTDWGLRRVMNRHVRESTEMDYLAAKTRRMAAGE